MYQIDHFQLAVPMVILILSLFLVYFLLNSSFLLLITRDNTDIDTDTERSHEVSSKRTVCVTRENGGRGGENIISNILTRALCAL